MRVCFIVGADVDNITFHNQGGYITVHLFQGCRLVNDPGMPAPAGKGGMEDHAVKFVVFNIFDNAFDLG